MKIKAYKYLVVFAGLLFFPAMVQAGNNVDLQDTYLDLVNSEAVNFDPGSVQHDSEAGSGGQGAAPNHSLQEMLDKLKQLSTY